MSSHMNYRRAARVKNAKEWAWDDRFQAPERRQIASGEQHEMILALCDRLGRDPLAFPTYAVDARLEIERLSRVLDAWTRMRLSD